MENMHSKDCCYRDVAAVSYALMELPGYKEILISANEVSKFDEYLKLAHDDDKDIFIDFETCDHEPYQLVYGALKFHGIDKEHIIDYVYDSKERALIDLDGVDMKNLVASSYADICLFTDRMTRPESIPFVALMQTMCEEKDGTSVTMFPCCDMTVWENMVNRSFLLACRKFVSIDNLTLENWKEHVDMNVLDDAYRLSGIYTGELDE